MRLAAALLAAGLAAGPAVAARDRDPLAGRVAGAPVRCISDTATSGPTVIDRTTILYSQTGRRTWVTHPVDSCPSLAPLNTLIVEKWGNQTCANDRFRVLEPGTSIPSAYCRFGPFTPYDKPR